MVNFYKRKPHNMVMLFNSCIFTLYKTSQRKYTIQTISYKNIQYKQYHTKIKSVYSTYRPGELTLLFFYTDKFT